MLPTTLAQSWDAPRNMCYLHGETSSLPAWPRKAWSTDSGISNTGELVKSVVSHPTVDPESSPLARSLLGQLEHCQAPLALHASSSVGVGFARTDAGQETEAQSSQLPFLWPPSEGRGFSGLEKCSVLSVFNSGLGFVH